MATENNNQNKELYSRPAILEVILNEYKQKPISFLELLGDGTGAEFYATWLNIESMILIERDKKKYDAVNVDKILEDKCSNYFFHNVDLSKYFSGDYYYSKPYYDSLYRSIDVINLDFCTFLWDNNKDNCTASVIKTMFQNQIPKDGGLVFFTFMITGWGANMNKDAIKNKNEIATVIDWIARQYGYETEEILAYAYKSSKPTTMLNYGIKVRKQ